MADGRAYEKAKQELTDIVDDLLPFVEDKQRIGEAIHTLIVECTLFVAETIREQ
jgi:hypothetical protein